MRLLRVGRAGQEQPAVLIGSDVVDVSSQVDDYDRAFFESDGLARVRDLVRASADSLPVVRGEFRIGPPICRPGKIVCVGHNYEEHVAEVGAPRPSEPLIFFKAPNTVVGPIDDVFIPRASVKTDWEVELGVVIGKTARYLSDVNEAADVIAGYCVSHDVSEREFQLERGGQFVKGKSCETFNPLGPWLVTSDDIEDPQKLGLWLQVNGAFRQRGDSSSMIFSVVELIYHLSQFMVLEPGDLVNTGTPAGVGLAMNPPSYLAAGDVVRLGIDGLGEQRQRFVPAP